MDSQPAIVIDHLHITIGGQAAVQDLSFSIDAGRTLAIIGESGSGKTHVPLAMMGLLPEFAIWTGAIRLNDAQITPDTPQQLWEDIRGRVVSIVFARPVGRVLDPVMKVGSQLAEILQINSGVNSEDARISAIEWLGRVQIPEPEKTYYKYPHQLSGGQTQRLMIAMAMSAQPALLILDEPTDALDVIERAEIIQLIKSLQQETGTALIVITDDFAAVAEMADDVLVMRNGEVSDYGPAGQVLANPQQPYTKTLLASRPAAVSKGQRLPAAPERVHAIPSTPTFQHSNTPAKDVLLKVRHLRIWFPTQYDWLGTPTHFLRAVEDISFDLCYGEILGLVGESGCGKSAIASALMGLQSVESGQMLFEGRDLVRMHAGEWSSMRRAVQIVLPNQGSLFNPRLTVEETILEPLLAHRVVPRREARKEVRRLIDSVHLSADILKCHPHQLSGEQHLRIGIARATALRPKLIICDESLSALDISAQSQILNLLQELQAELKLSYLFISNDLNAVHYIADRVMVMHAGKIIERGIADDVLKHPKEPYTKKLVASVPSF